MENVSMMWRSDEPGPEGHGGRAVAVLEDGTDAEPILCEYTVQDPSSPRKGQVERFTTSYWWDYDGEAARQLAVAVRPVCDCGWEGAERYPALLDDPTGTEGDETSGPYGEWHAHIQQVLATVR
ncbi:hypothetical protein AB4225_29455 [Streptomyces sp. 2RAF24]|uniref:hypothetical protein n=1 Tax=Streptomyces sp. 2RAF24 TaxID=3232997 RepID=UPI003F982534